MVITIFTSAEGLAETEMWVEEYSRDEYSRDVVDYVICVDSSIDVLRESFSFCDERGFFLIKRGWYFDYVAETFFRRIGVNHVFRSHMVTSRPGYAADGDFEALGATSVYFCDESPRSLSMRLLGRVSEGIRRYGGEFDVIVVPSVVDCNEKFFDISPSEIVIFYSYIVVIDGESRYFIPGMSEFNDHNMNVDEDDDLVDESYSYSFDIKLLLEYKTSHVYDLFHIMFKHGIDKSSCASYFDGRV